jgi:hypothetical protein
MLPIYSLKMAVLLERAGMGSIGMKIKTRNDRLYSKMTKVSSRVFKYDETWTGENHLWQYQQNRPRGKLSFVNRSDEESNSTMVIQISTRLPRG